MEQPTVDIRPREPIAIVGIGCRFPGADGPGAYWRLLRKGREAIREVPAGRWGGDDFYDPDPAAPGKTDSRWGGFLDQVDGFDHAFFGLSAEEAAAMDPQQRLLLEVAWEALEDAGQVPSALAASSTGVYVGIMHFEYGHLHLSQRESIGPLTGPGMSLSIAANRLSYLLDLRGPSLAVDTACSSSLVATQLACASLRRGECEVALAGGVNLLLGPTGHVFFTKAGVMSPDGRCRVLDAGANGIVRGEGAGIVVLKTLSRARADGDRIYARILGGAVNHDGASNGLMAPSRLAQEALLRAACRDASVSPGGLDYVELHGTGTPMGDPIEATAVGRVMAGEREGGSRCALGSVKSNFGHLEAAAGVAGLIKVALMLERRERVPSLHFETPNPRIPFDRLPIEVQRERSAWTAGTRIAGARIAGVSSFGFGGTNAHLVLAEAEADAERAAGSTRPHVAARAPGPPQLLTLSARGESALRAAASRWAEALEALDEEAVDLADVGYTAGARRQHSPHRLAAVGRDPRDLARRLRAFGQSGEGAGIATGRRPPRGCRTLFVFCGQGPQRPGMAAELMAEPAFRDVIERCQRLFAEHAAWSLWDEIAAPETFSRLDQTEIAQPALFAVQVALAALWRSWGVEPTAVIGHSLGEVAAAHVAGALSLPDAVRVVFERSRLMQRATGQGRMAAVTISASRASEVLAGYGGRLGIAAINGPASTVLSGLGEPLRQALSELEDLGASHRLLEVDYAFHGPQMNGLAEELGAALAGVEPRPARIPTFSTVTGGLAAGDALGAGHWARQLTSPVRFADALSAAAEPAPEAVLEIGPHPVLAGDVRACLEGSPATRILPSLRRGHDDRTTLMSSLGGLYAAGADLDWGALFPRGGRLVRLPTYPWQRRRAWLRGDAACDTPKRPAPNPSGHPLLLGPIRLVAPRGARLWEFELDRQAFAYLDDHRVEGAIVMPGAVYVEMALAAAVTAFGHGTVEASDVRLSKALFLPAEGTVRLQLMLQPATGEALSFHLASLAAGSASAEPVLHATGTLRRLTAGTPRDSSLAALTRVRRRCTTEIDPGAHYRMLRANRFDYGEAFQNVRRLRRGEGEALARVELSETLSAAAGRHQIHPALLDTAFQVVMAAGRPPASLAGGVFLPTSIDRVCLHVPLGAEGWTHGRARSFDDQGPCGDVRFFTRDGELALELIGLRCRRIDPRPARHDLEELLYELAWIESEPMASGGPESWLLLADASGAAESFAAAARSRGESAELWHGDEPLAGVLDRLGPDLSRVVDLRALDGSPDAPGEAAARRCAAALEPLSALSRRHSSSRAPRLWWVSAGTQAVAGSEVASTALPAAALWGLSQTVAHEHPGLWGGIVDLPGDAARDELADALDRALRRGDGESQVAVRGGRSYVARLERPARPSSRADAYRPRPEATYLVSGGLGGVGFEVARWLVDAGARHLVLLSRSAGASPRRTEARELERRGARLRIASVDVADEEALRGLLSSLEADGWPALAGVVHAAGVAHPRALVDTREPQLQDQLRAKVAGGWLLHRLTESLDLDFFVLFSSVAALLPPQAGGLAGYAAGNRFLDALAHHRKHLGLPALAIGWGPWSDVGLAAAHAPRLRAEGLGPLAPARGVAALARLLAPPSPGPQVAVVEMDWPRWRRAHSAAAEAPLVRSLTRPASPPSSAPSTNGDSLRRRWLRAEPAARPGLVAAELERLVASHLPYAEDGLDSARPLVDLGLDSLAAAEIRNRLAVDTGLDLPVTRLLGGASLEGLADWVEDELSSLPDSGGTSAEPGSGGTPSSLPTSPFEKGGSRGISRGQRPRAPAAFAEAGGTPSSLPTSPFEKGGSRGISRGQRPRAPAAFAEAGGTPSSLPTSIDDPVRDHFARADYRRRPWLGRLSQLLFRAVIRMSARVDARGGERVPEDGPLIIAYNHPSKLDKIGLMAYPSRRTVLLAAGYARYRPLLRRLLDLAVETIFIDRGAGDLQALDQSLAVLRAGGALSMSPEGEIAGDGTLQPAKPGIAFLAARAQARVLPVAAWGHERALTSWRRLRRAPVSLRVGEPLPSPTEDASPRDLELYTDRVMRALAELLPEEYRGVYS